MYAPGPPTRVRLLDVSAAAACRSTRDDATPAAVRVVARGRGGWPGSMRARLSTAVGDGRASGIWRPPALSPIVCSCVQIFMRALAPCTDKLAWFIAQIDVHGGRVGFL